VSARLAKAIVMAAMRSGSAGRAWGARLDVLRSTGVGYARQRRAELARERQTGRAALERFYRDVWASAAAELGAEVSELEGGFLEIRRGAVATRVWRQLSALDDAVSLKAALDKTLVHGLLAARGVHVPDHLEFARGNIGPALRFIAESGAGSFVVKPADGGRGGAGVTGGVRTELDLARAALTAARLDSRLLIERQVPGDMHRLLFCDGELLDVVVRLAPHVTGDGRSSILELIARENERRLEAGLAQSLITVDLDCLLALAAVGRAPRSVPSPGERVQVKSASSENAEHENRTIRSWSGDLVSECAEAVRAVGLRLAGVDVVTPDIDRPLAETGGAIIEVNGTPGFQYHHVVAEPENATRIAVPVLEQVLEATGLPTTITPG
jgi:D-alanine-D-alanine ligase-like ATP-grasp enzyme